MSIGKKHVQVACLEREGMGLWEIPAVEAAISDQIAMMRLRDNAPNGAAAVGEYSDEDTEDMPGG